MFKFLFLSLISFVFFACSGGSGGSSGSSTSYKYQISGTTALVADAMTILDESRSDIGAFANSFILKWNEDGSGNITGIYTNQTTGESLSVTGTSNGSGREITATRSSAISGILTIKLIISQVGDLDGSVSATIRQYNSSNVQVGMDETITVSATTTGGSSGGGGGGGGSTTGTLNSYIGVYTGTVAEVSNTAISPAVGNGKYCDLTFVGSELKFELSNYLIFGYSVEYSNGNGAYQDIAGADPAALNITINKGFPSATLLDAGYHDTGVKITAADQSGGKQLTMTFVGSFSGTATKTLSGTLTAKLNSTSICSFTVSMTKQ